MTDSDLSSFDRARPGLPGQDAAPDMVVDRSVLEAVEAALELPAEERRRFIEATEALGPAERLRAIQLLAGCERVEQEDAARQQACGADGNPIERQDAEALAIDLASLLRAADWRSTGAERLPEGWILGHYRIERFIAAGGMGEVYAAIDTRIGRRVAIKILPRFADQGLAHRFAREARIMARLEHPSIARLYEWSAPAAGEAGHAYIVMEFVEGVPLREAAAVLRGGGGGADKIVRLVLPVVEAVAHAHARGVLHRDIKPGNILVDSSGSARLLDFGVGAILESEEMAASTLTQAGAPGTLNYMSPEHVRGGAPRVTVRSDVYGLGLVLYETLAGRPAIEAAGRGIAEIVESVVRVDPPALPLRALAAGSDLEFIVRRALRKDPDERYASADALAEDLRRFLVGEAPLGRELSSIRVLRGLARRNRRGLAVGAGALAAVAVGVLFGVSQFVRAREAEARAEVIVGELLEGSKPLISGLHQRLLEDEQPLVARRAALEATVEYLEWVLRNSGQDDRVLREVAERYRVLGQIAGSAGIGSLGDTDSARKYYLRSMEILDAQIALREKTGEAGADADDAERELRKTLLLLRSRVLREYAGLIDYEQRAPLFLRANEDQRKALQYMPEGPERVATERFLLFTEVQHARLASDADGFDAPLAGLRRIAATPGQAGNSELFSEIGIGERYCADVLELAGRFDEAIAHARAAQEALQRSMELGQDDFTNQRHLARVDLLLAARTAADRASTASTDMLRSALLRSQAATNLNPRSSFHRLSHLEFIVLYADAARVVAALALEREGAKAAGQVVAAAQSLLDEHLAFTQSLPVEGLPHRGEPKLLADLERSRKALGAVVEADQPSR